ncbi:hypothetical protein KI387_000687, partial [Taxus chinensis]
MVEFENAYNSICRRLETLRSIYVSSQKVSLAGSPENNVHRSRRYKTSTEEETDGVLYIDTVCPAEISGEEKNYVGCSVNAKESITDHATDPVENDAVNTHHTPGVPCEKENPRGLNKSIRSPQSMQNFKEQAQKWVGEQIIGVFEEHSGEMRKNCTLFSDNTMSDIVKNVSQILQERVNQIEMKTQRVAELKEALSKEKPLVDSMRQTRHGLQGLLNQACSTAENGIFMCSQCQFVAEVVKELEVHAKLDTSSTICQFMTKDESETCCNVNNLQKKNSSSVTSMHRLPDREDGTNDISIIPLVEDTNNAASRLCPRVVNETCKMHHGNILEVEDSKLVNVIARRLGPGLESGFMTDSVPSLKRKSINDGCVKEAGPPKASKFIVQSSKLQCSNVSRECYSKMSSENYCARHSHDDVV